MSGAKKIMMGGGAVASAYEIDQSLIFDKAGAASLVRTPGSASNQRTWTWSGWVKRSSTDGSSIFTLFSADGSSDNCYIVFYLDDLYINDYDYSETPGIQWLLITDRKFRDFGAWYHIVFAVDTTQGTAANRLKLYVNGVQETSFSTETYPAQNHEGSVNSTKEHHVGTAFTSASNYSLGGQLAEVNFVDGSQLTPSSFGETNEDTGQWIPKKYSGSYGTNGFYLKFVSGAIGTDSSGEGNNYTASNLANHDVVTDTPTNNFATYNPLVPTPYYVFSEGNLKVTVPGQWRATIASMGVSTGKWYWEQLVSSGAQNTHIGFVNDLAFSDNASTNYPGINANGWSYYGYSGRMYYNGGVYGAALTATSTSGGKIGIAMDLDNQKVWFSLNGTWMGTDANPSTGAGAAITNIVAGTTYYPATTVHTLSSTANFGQNGTFSGLATAQGNTDANGIGDFFYPVPTSFKALSTANLPTPAIPLPSAHFNTVLYAGTGSAQTISGVGFQPDFSWTKCRGAETWHHLVDAVRGSNKELFSNSTYQEVNAAGGARAMTFESDGFAWGGNSGDVNGSGRNYVSWNWKANGTGSTDTSGDIDAVVSANQAAGFSIVTWTGDGGAHTTVPHGLGVAPEIIFEKYRNAAGAWYTWVTAIDGTNDYLILNTTAAAGDAGASGTPTSQFFSNWGSANGRTNVAYAFASKPGFSKIGVYTGNGAADGPMVNTGFKPAWIMIKRTDAVKGWYIRDTAREPSNVMDTALLAQVPDAEVSSANYNIDYLSNGFKPRSTHASSNANGGTYLYMAFAESPFKTANAR